ncbi:MAG: site-2 protease family protein [Candidatus Omnitrophica bacterium]|nr:site-2 protease family protein [Candidatus Omnitrophota bacterium]
MGLLFLFFKDPLLLLILLFPLIYSIIIHEAAHGLVAYAFGDDTAKRYGRLTLNPLPHLDGMGLLLLLLIGFGWAKPVPVDYSKLKNFRVGLICVSLAGCLANFLLALGALLLMKKHIFDTQSVFYMMLYILAKVNIILCAFNLIPIPPLDGSKILMGFLSVRAQVMFMRIEPYSLFILAALLFLGILRPVIDIFQTVILRLVGIILR